MYVYIIYIIMYIYNYVQHTFIENIDIYVYIDI